ncbi:MAG: site-specific DNA-methyltransferase [Thermoplasmata archaeon]
MVGPEPEHSRTVGDVAREMRAKGGSARAPDPRVVPELDRIICGDARTVLRRLPKESVHLAITSPPYNVGIAYSDYSDARSYLGYREWLRGIWTALERVLVPGGRFALNVAPTSIKNFRPIHHDLTRDLIEVGFLLRTEILWYKQTMGRRTAWGSWKSPANPHVIPSWEYVLVFSKGSWRLEGDRAEIDITGPEFQRYSDGFWAIPPERNRRDHPAPFPDELIRRLIKFYSYRGNVVLDMFGGTGTVAAVARANGRHYLSIDTSREYCERARERVAGARAEGPGPPIPAPARVETVSELVRERRTRTGRRAE